jgi:hypothetical protein
MLSLTYQPQPPTAILNRHFQFLLKDRRMTDKTSPNTARKENPRDVVLFSICFLFLAVLGISLASCFKSEALLEGASEAACLNIFLLLTYQNRDLLYLPCYPRDSTFLCLAVVWKSTDFYPQSQSTSCPCCCLLVVGWGVEDDVRQSGPLDDDMSGPEATRVWDAWRRDILKHGPLLAWPSRMSGVHESSSSHGSEPIGVVPLSPPLERKFQLVVRKTDRDRLRHSIRQPVKPSRSW